MNSAHATKSQLEVTVADHGPGVSPEELPRLFAPFYRADSSRTRDTGGVGLGLTLCQRIIEAHHGTISAANREGGGLVVTLALEHGPQSSTGT